MLFLMAAPVEHPVPEIRGRKIRRCEVPAERMNG